MDKKLEKRGSMLGWDRERKMQKCLLLLQFSDVPTIIIIIILHITAVMINRKESSYTDNYVVAGSVESQGFVQKFVAICLMVSFSVFNFLFASFARYILKKKKRLNGCLTCCVLVFYGLFAAFISFLVYNWKHEHIKEEQEQSCPVWKHIFMSILIYKILILIIIVIQNEKNEHELSRNNEHELPKYKNLINEKLNNGNTLNKFTQPLHPRPHTHFTNNNNKSNIPPSPPVNIRLIKSFRMWVAGPSGCGKTHFLVNLIKNLQNYCQEPPDKVLFVYRTYQDLYSTINEYVSFFIEDQINLTQKVQDKIDEWKADDYSILIIADDMLLSKDRYFSEMIGRFFTTGRHNKISTIYVTQKCYPNDQHLRMAHQNTNYGVYFNNNHDTYEINSVCRRISHRGSTRCKDIEKIFDIISENPYGYLFINFTPERGNIYLLSELFDVPHRVRVFKFE